MQALPRRSNPRPARSVLSASLVALLGALPPIVGCQSDDLGPGSIGSSGNGMHPARGSSGKSGSSGSSGSSSGATNIATGGATSTGGAPMGGTPGAGGTVMSSGGVGNASTAGGTGGAGGAGSGGVSAGSAGMSMGGMSATSGAGGSAGGAVAGGAGMPEPPKPCVDVQPPADPEWPGAMCEDWATQTKECAAEWFAPYCDVSCGRCVPEGGAGTGGAVDCSTAGLPNVTGGDGFATRYWDCCQTHCGQSDGHRCSKDGTSRTGDTNSACNGGGSFACYDEAPHAISDCLSYGYMAKANPNCGGCYRIQFTGEGKDNANDPGSKLIKGKQMIVKVSNTGGDVASNQFDLMIPGGGVGKFNACSNQWGTSDLGAQYGGFFSGCSGAYSAKKQCARDACMKLPSGQMRDGCIWFIDWLQAADNPKFTSQQTDCPF
ncbi:MAG TPA: hypothetical protein VNN72_11390 [Polyangiaceae bacterium]|nr:hypothetical protein [Polyangiaceae bacterium]